MYEAYHVLFVDDEEDILRSLKRGLIDEEYTCHFAVGAYKALEILEHEPISVLVTDMKMPGMDGLQFLNKVRDKWPHIVRIVLSAYVQLPQILLCINQAGIFKFITKPWRMEDEFIGIIREALDLYMENEERKSYKKKLELQTTMHLRLVRKMDDNILFLKNNIDLLTAIGTYLLDIYQFPRDQEITISTKQRNLQKNLFDFFHKGVISTLEDYPSTTLTDQLSQFIAQQFATVNITKLTNTETNVSTFYPMIEALLALSNVLFYDVFSSGASSRVGVEDNGFFCLYLVAPFNVDDPQTQSIIDQKLDYLSAFFALLSGFQLTCFAEKYGKKIVIGIFIDHTPAL